MSISARSAVRRTAAAATYAVLAACAPQAAVPPAPFEPMPEPLPQPAVTLPDTPPPPAPADPVQLPPVSERTLANGARVLLVQHDEQPFVSVNLRIRSGAAADPDGRAGVAALTASLLNKGTATRSSREIAETVDFVGAQLSATAGQDWTSVTLGTLTEFLDTGLDVLADVVMRPTFPSEELETERRRVLSGLQVELSEPVQLAIRRFHAEVYGAHPYGRAQTPESVQAITRDEIVAFHASHYTPGNALFVVAGDVDADDIVARLEQRFAEWTGGLAPSLAAPDPPAQTHRRLVFVHKPGTVQAVLRLGHLMPPASSPDWVEIDVANQVLGGDVGSWLFRVLRDERGYTYGAYSRAVENVGPGYFWAYAQVRNEVADSATEELLGLVRRLRTEAPPVAELTDAKNFLSGSFPLTIETPQQVASQVATTILLERPADYLETFRSRVNAVDTTDVLRIAQRYIDPDRAVLVVVGDAQQLYHRLARFGQTTELYDDQGRPLSPDQIAPAAGDNDLVFDASSIRPATQAYVVSFQGNPVGEATTIVTREQHEGRPVIRSTTTIRGAVTQRQHVVFEPAEFAPIEAGIEGPITLSLRAVDDRITGQVAALGGEAREIDLALEPGTLLPGMEEYAIAVTDLEQNREFRLPIVDPQTGTITTLSVRVTGEERIDVPAGSFDVYRLELSGPQATTLYVRQTAPHIVVKQEFAGQPVAIELSEIR
ncbi:MAG: M16 family metallopeptidase [Longimicrobiales bacterium]